MPAYDYRCTACDQVFEVNRSIGDDSTVTCPSCNGETRKVFSPVGVVFKGSGFYNTDYKNKNAGDASKETPSASDSPSAAPCAASTPGGSCAGCPSAAAE